MGASPGLFRVPGPGIAKRVLGFFAVAKPTIATRVFADLSERGLELLALMGQGRSNQEIAEQLGLTLKTVRNHVSNIFSKLQVADRAQAVLRAREAGLDIAKAKIDSREPVPFRPGKRHWLS